MKFTVGETVKTPDGLAIVTKIEGIPPVHKTWVRLKSNGIDRWYTDENIERMVWLQ